jgi:outer membrane protein TolC
MSRAALPLAAAAFVAGCAHGGQKIASSKCVGKGGGECRPFAIAGRHAGGSKSLSMMRGGLRAADEGMGASAVKRDISANNSNADNSQELAGDENASANISAAARPVAISPILEELTGSIEKQEMAAAPGVTASIGSVSGPATGAISGLAHSWRDLPSILRHTLRDNPDIGMALARENDERVAIEIAKAARRPEVSVRAAYGLENFLTESKEQFAVRRGEIGVDLHQTIVDFGRSRGNIMRRKALYSSAVYRRQQRMNQLAMEVSGSFLAIREAMEHLAIARNNVASHREILRLVKASQQEGNSSLADVKRVTARLEKARTALIDLQSRLERDKREFLRLTGLRAESLDSPPRLEAMLPPRDSKPERWPDNPELLSVRADMDSLRAQLDAARAGLKPSIDLDASGSLKDNVSGETGMTRDFKAMLSFNYKLLDGGKGRNVVRQIKFRMRENLHRYRKKRRDYINDLGNAIRNVRAARRKKSLLQRRLGDSRKVLELYKAQFRDGSKTVFELLDAQMDLFAAASEKIANDYSLLRASYEIYALRGALVGRILMEG